jgi:hypothetical protein
MFLSNNYSRTTTVGAGSVRVIFWVQPWAPDGRGQTTSAMVVRRIAGSVRVIFWVQPWAPDGRGQTTSAMVVRRIAGRIFCISPST